MVIQLAFVFCLKHCFCSGAHPGQKQSSISSLLTCGVGTLGSWRQDVCWPREGLGNWLQDPSANIRNLTNHLLEYMLLVVQDHTESMKSCCQQHQDASMPYRANCGKHFGLTRRMIKTMGLSWFPKSTGESNTFRMKLYSTSWGCSIYETHPYVLAPVCGMGLGLLLHQLPLPCACHDSIEDCSWNHGLQTPETKLKFQTHATCKRNISNIYIYELQYGLSSYIVLYYGRLVDVTRVTCFVKLERSREYSLQVPVWQGFKVISEPMSLAAQSCAAASEHIDCGSPELVQKH